MQIALQAINILRNFYNFKSVIFWCDKNRRFFHIKKIDFLERSGFFKPRFSSLMRGGFSNHLSLEKVYRFLKSGKSHRGKVVFSGDFPGETTFPRWVFRRWKSTGNSPGGGGFSRNFSEEITFSRWVFRRVFPARNSPGEGGFSQIFPGKPPFLGEFSRKCTGIGGIVRFPKPGLWPGLNDIDN